MAQPLKTAFLCSDRLGRPYVLICSLATNSGGEVRGSRGRAVSIASLDEAPGVAHAQGATLVTSSH